jgi:hypothetical protein
MGNLMDKAIWPHEWMDGWMDGWVIGEWQIMKE